MNAKTESGFLDTNVLLYLLSEDERKASRAEELVSRGGWISVQVLNEFASVASRKYKLPWSEIREVLTAVRANCRVTPLTVPIHDRALDLIQDHSLSFYDAVIVAAALESGCSTLWSEDMQEGQVFDEILQLKNPFRKCR